MRRLTRIVSSNLRCLQIQLFQITILLARLNEAQKELLHYPPASALASALPKYKSFTLKFLYDGQGADRRATLFL